MTSSDISEIYRFLQREDARLTNLFITKWNNIYVLKQFDTLDLLDLIELSVQMDYLGYIWVRLQKVINYLHDIS